MKKQLRVRSLITAAVMAAVMTVMPFCSARAYAAGPQSSFEYKKYPTHTEYMKDLSIRMSNVYNSISGKTDDAKIIPVPGIVKTYIRTDGERYKSENYVPQGICRVGRYILITAYDAKKKNNSVVYVIDTGKNELISTLTMPNRYHAGGIAFDGENIWMTGNTSDKYEGEPFVQYMEYDTFVSLIKKPLAEVSRDELSVHITINNRPSFLEYDNGVLWVGTYAGSKESSEGYMNGYPIVKRNGKTTLNTLMYSIITGIDSSSQGADIDGNNLYVSSSYNGMLYGVKTSFITKYSIKSIKKGAETLSVSGKELSRVEVPKMNEGILIEGPSIYVLFESGAKQYKYCVMITDRILALNRSLWN